MQYFSVDGGPKNVWGGPIFRGWNEILLLDKALKFGEIVQKCSLELRIIWKIIEKLEKNAKFSEIF